MPTTYLSRDTLVYLRAADQTPIEVSLKDLAVRLVIPDYRFYYATLFGEGSRQRLCNSLWFDTGEPKWDPEASMYWKYMLNKPDETPKESLNNALNISIAMRDATMVHNVLDNSINPDFDLLMTALEEVGRWRKEKRFLHVESGMLFLPAETGYKTWPVKMIKEAGFDYWWRNFGAKHIAEEDKPTVYALCHNSL